jgi:hypothetical protein
MVQHLNDSMSPKRKRKEKKREIYHPSVYRDPWIDCAICISFSNWQGPQISNFVGESSSAFRTSRSFSPDGDGTTADTPLISIGKGDHWKLTDFEALLEMWEFRRKFLFLLAKRSDWLIETIALDVFSLDHQKTSKKFEVTRTGLEQNNSQYRFWNWRSRPCQYWVSWRILATTWTGKRTHPPWKDPS